MVLFAKCPNALPQQVDFTATEVCFGTPTTLIATSNVPDIKYFKWDFEGGGNNFNDTTGQVLSIIFEKPDTFSVGVMVITNSGLGYSINNFKEVIVHPLPQPAFTAEYTCYEQKTRLISKSSIQSGSIAGIYWDIDNNNTSDYSSSDTIYHLFSDQGVFPVKLTLTSNHNCSNSLVNDITVYETPQARFTAENACAFDTVHFFNHSTVQADTLKECIWKFGDGSQVRSLENVYYPYTKADNYVVTLITISNHLCSDTFSIPIEIYSKTPLNFSYSGDTIFYDGDNVTIYAEGAFTNYLWSNAETSNTLTVNKTGTYSLEAVDANGCVSKKFTKILVKDAFNRSIIIAENSVITPNGDGYNDYLFFKDIDGYGDCELIIYNRYGTEMERIKGYNNDWSGTANGKPLPTGTYFYIIQNDEISSKGSINILRQK